MGQLLGQGHQDARQEGPPHRIHGNFLASRITNTGLLEGSLDFKHGRMVLFYFIIFLKIRSYCCEVPPVTHDLELYLELSYFLSQIYIQGRTKPW